jgi:Flp pilus assembly pilin Flp
MERIKLISNILRAWVNVTVKKKGASKGANMLEYVLIASLIITLTWIGINALGGALGDFFNNLAEWVTERGNNLPRD